MLEPEVDEDPNDAPEEVLAEPDGGTPDADDNDEVLEDAAEHAEAGGE